MSSSMKVCEHHAVQSIVGPSHSRGDDGLQVERVGVGGELVAPHILHSPDITDRRRPSLLGLQICQASFASFGQPRQLQDLPGPSNVDFMLAERNSKLSIPSYREGFI